MIAAPGFAIFSTMQRQKVKILIGKIDDARQEKMKPYWGSAVGTLVLSSIFLERQGIVLRDTWALT